MIILEQANRIVESLLKELFNQAKSDVSKINNSSSVCADFDSVLFCITVRDKTAIVSVKMECAEQLKQYGAQEYLQSIYKSNLVQPESGYSFSVSCPLMSGTDEVARQFALLKRHAFASPFYRAFELMGKSSGVIMDIPYRGGERMFVIPGQDRCTVVYQINFKDPEDLVIGKIFLGEFKKSISGAPPIDFVQNVPPGEISSIRNLGRTDGYVTTVLYKHNLKPEIVDRTVDMTIMFRNYLMYHIKCSKSHLNTRMRLRVDMLLKVLNRAKQELPKEKKTATGRTFIRRG